jgi:hypothetical protein
MTPIMVIVSLVFIDINLWLRTKYKKKREMGLIYNRLRWTVHLKSVLFDG